jgi:hypothetical protein
MEKKTFTRKGLYDLVWKEPLSRLAKKYKISDNGLRKICKRMNIPLPPNGHWQKVQFGYKVTPIKLSEKYKGKNEVTLDERGLNEVVTESPQAILKRITKEIENTSGLSFKVNDRLSRPDKLITSTIKFYQSLKRYRKTNRGEYPSRIDVLNIDVSEDNEHRACLIMDTIIKLLRARHHDVLARFRETVAVIQGEEIKIRIREKQNFLDARETLGKTFFLYSGELIFVIGDYNKKEFRDGAEKLENKISSIVAYLEYQGNIKKDERIKWEIRRKEEERQEQIRREFKERQDKEVKEFKNLFLQAIRLHQANILRTYIQTVDSNMIKNGKLTEDYASWKAWAENKISWYDPLINGADPLLNDFHKTHIFMDLIRELQ